jgi:hypothetical protein
LSASLAQIIGKAKVPIVKYEDAATGLNLDVSFDATNGPQAAEYVQRLMARLPPMRPLTLLLKLFLHQRELNEARAPRQPHRPLLLDPPLCRRASCLGGSGIPLRWARL